MAHVGDGMWMVGWSMGVERWHSVPHIPGEGSTGERVIVHGQWEHTRSGCGFFLLLWVGCVWRT